MTSRHPPDYNLCMWGAIRTKERCPACGGKFVEGKRGLQCPKCLTTPRKYFLDIPQLGANRKLYSDTTGHPFDSYERASQELSTIRTEVRKGTFDPRNYVKRDLKGLLFSNYADLWLERQEKRIEGGYISREYFRSVKSLLKNHLVPFFGKRNIRDIHEGLIEDFLLQLPSHLSAKTRQTTLALMRKIFSDALRRRDIMRAPDFPRVEVGETVTKWIAPEEQEAILAQVKDPILRALFVFLIHMGTRPNEARALRWEDLNFKAGLVTISAAIDQNVYRPYTKEREVRELPLPPEVIEALKSIPRSLSGFVFTRTGKPLSANLVRATWRRAARAAGLTIGCYQGTKHSLGCWAVNSGIPLNVIQDYFGHKSSATTRRYAKLRVDALRVMHRSWPQSVPKAREQEEKP